MKATTRFIQIHMLTDHHPGMPNRDDTGMAKRMPYGGVHRNRISSQRLKNCWINTDHEDSIQNIPGIERSVRSRKTVERMVMKPVRDSGQFDEGTLKAVEDALHAAIYSENATDESKRQALLLGMPEIEFFREKALEICRKHNGNAEDAAKETREMLTGEHGAGQSFKGLLEGAKMPGGITAALAGRMVTSDRGATIEAPLHVAHAITVHAVEAELDYFSVVDQLIEADEESGAAYIGRVELTAGLFYSYAVIDVPGLISNTEGVPRGQWLEADPEISAQVVRNLLVTMAQVSPSAKRGSTADYGHAELVLIEIGSRQPRSLAKSFREPLPASQSNNAPQVMAGHLEGFDRMYGQREARRVSTTHRAEMPGASNVIFDDLLEWTVNAVRNGEAE